jgi:hypothetical protein
MWERAVFPAWGVVVALGLAVASGALAGTDPPTDDERASTSGQSDGPRPESIRTAIERALPLLIKASALEYPKHRECFSCHNQAVPAVSLALARQRGFAVPAQTLRAISEHTEADLNGALDDYRKGKGQPGGVTRAGYALWTLEATGWPADETTAAVAGYLAAAQGERDHWASQSRRPPSESSSFTATALALRSLQAFGAPAPETTSKVQPQPAGPSQPSKATAVRARALRWLLQAEPRETEDRVFRLWGLKHAGASAKDLAAAATDLLRTQRPDGGWCQLDAPAEPDKSKDEKGRIAAGPPAAYFLASDAYATGSALVALHQAGGMDADLPAFRRGLDFLIRSQRDDGSWFVKSRSHPFQTYFESGFPHGPDQFISAAASAWAVAALALASPAP